MHRKATVLTLCALAAVLLLVSLRLPIWQMKMEAPQYQGEEALEVVIYPNAMRGDIDELKVLNSYIGVHIPEEIPQTRWIPAVLILGGIAGFLAALLPGKSRKWALIIVPSVLVCALGFAAIQAQWQMHEIGTNRDKKTVMLGVKDFTPPLVGKTKVAQFTITSFLSWGSFTVGCALVLLFTAAWLSRSSTKKLNPRDPEPSSGPVGDLAINPPSA